MINLIRISGLIAAVLCCCAGGVFAAYNLIIGQTGNGFELVSALCGAALFFAAPYAIVPARSEENAGKGGLDLLGEICASGFYAVVLLATAWLGLPYLYELFQPAAANTASAPQTGLLILLAGFAYSLTAHLLATVSAVWMLFNSRLALNRQ